jgi:hypothetical protein
MGSADNGLCLAPGDWAEYRLEKSGRVRRVHRVRMVFDSDLNRDTQPEGTMYRRNMYTTVFLDTKAAYPSRTLTRDFRLTLTLADGTSRVIDVNDNHRRLVYADIGAEVSAVRFEPLATWGNPEAHIFSFEIE